MQVKTRRLALVCCLLGAAAHACALHGKGPTAEVEFERTTSTASTQGE